MIFMLTREQYKKRKEMILYAKLCAIVVLAMAIVAVLFAIILG